MKVITEDDYQYIVDDAGNKTHIILEIEEYEELLDAADLGDLEDDEDM